MNNIITQEDKDRIDEICEEIGVYNYVINQDLSIDVNGEVSLPGYSYSELPVTFNKVSGSFNCGYIGLTTLFGCPKIVGGSFYCMSNDLTSLIYCPSEVGGEFLCYDNILTSLEHCITEVNGDFACNWNKLSTLDYAPKSVSGSFDCSDNQLSTLKNIQIKVGENFRCRNNNFPHVLADALSTLFSDEYDSQGESTFGYHKGESGTKIFLQYMNYYDVWTPDLNVGNMQLLIDDINDGLR